MDPEDVKTRAETVLLCTLEIKAERGAAAKHQKHHFAPQIISAQDSYSSVFLEAAIAETQVDVWKISEPEIIFTQWMIHCELCRGGLRRAGVGQVPD
jgi:hypothetical protein